MSVAEETKPDAIPVVYGVADGRIAELREEFGGLTAETKEGYEATRKAIGVCRDLRVSIEKKRVELKADALAYGRKVDSEAKRLTGLLLEIEEPLQAEKAKIDDEKARIRREKEEAEKAAIAAIEKAKRDEEEAAAKAIRDAEEARLKIEREKLAAERAAMEAALAETAARQRAEQEKLDAERRKVEEQQRIEREKIEAAQAAIKAEQQRLERAEFERQAKEKAEVEARERVERERIAAEKAKAEREAAEKAEQARQDAMRPDVEKVRAMAGFIRAIPTPQVQAVAVVKFVAGIEQELEAIAAKCAAYKAK